MAKRKSKSALLGLSNTTLLLIGGGVALYYLTRPKTENSSIGNLNKKNTKEVIIIVPNETILKRAKSTPTFSRLTRKDLKVGINEEIVNNKQFADMKRLYPLINIIVEEKYKEIGKIGETYFKTQAEALEYVFDIVGQKYNIIFPENIWTQSVPYGKSVRYNLELYTFNGNLARKGLTIVLYRMDSGKYELTYYLN